jgi:archaellum component FlaC
MVEREPEPEQIQHLLGQLATAREEFRREVAAHGLEREKLERRKKQTQRLHAAARAERIRTRTLYRRFLRHMKRKWSAERVSVEAERQALERERTGLERREAEADAYNARLRDSWELLAESQRRFLVERQQAEHWIGLQKDTLDHRGETLAQQERQFAAARGELENQLKSLKAEIAGLDARAANARHTIEQLELKQSRLLVPADGFTEPISSTLVPLGHPAPANGEIDADDLLDDLHTRRQDLDRVRRKIFAARDEIERQTTNLDDQRAILSEQVATLVAARELWNSAELTTLAEMETLAKSLRGAERALELREQQLIEAERLSRERESELWTLREQLEAWRRTLAAHEAANLAARDQHWAALETEQQRQAWREQTLGEIAASWAEIRAKERDHYRSVVEHLEAERKSAAEERARAERERSHYAEQILQVASMRLAIEQRDSDETPAARRKLRILAAHWEKHFKRWERRLAAGKASAELSEARCRELEKGLHDRMDRWFEERSNATEARVLRDSERFQSQIERLHGTAAAELPERTERELARLNEEVERLAALIAGAGEVAEPAMLSH